MLKASHRFTPSGNYRLKEVQSTLNIRATCCSLDFLLTPPHVDEWMLCVFLFSSSYDTDATPNIWPGVLAL
jgi:hypothetical protein